MLTDNVKNALMTVNISLQEHVIISDDGFFTFRRGGYFEK
jgi:DNA repair protein RadC